MNIDMFYQFGIGFFSLLVFAFTLRSILIMRKMKKESTANPYKPLIVTTEPAQQLSSLIYTQKYIICIDFDDTLFPTSFCNNFERIYDHYHPPKDIAQIAEPLHDLLTNLIKLYGSENIFIVTNSLQPWIDHILTIGCLISPIFYQIKNLLRDNKINIVSARSMYFNHYSKLDNSQFIDSPSMWKQLVFQDIFRNKFNNLQFLYSEQVNIITIGDQFDDHNSAQMASNVIQQQCLQSGFCHFNTKQHKIKVTECLLRLRNIQYFKSQLNYINNLLQNIYNYNNGNNSYSVILP